jgi:hypothetical protein
MINNLSIWIGVDLGLFLAVAITNTIKDIMRSNKNE